MANRFLVFNDYKKQIQSDNLFQVLGIDSRNENYNSEYEFQEALTILEDAEQAGQEEMKSYLAQRYLVEQVFTNTAQFTTSGSSATTFFSKNLIEYTEPCYNSGNTYNSGQRISFCGNIYQNILTGSTSGQVPNTATTVWSAITQDKSLYYANLPIPEYDQTVTYYIGNIIWYQNVIYQAVRKIKGLSPAQSQNLELRYGVPSVLGNSNLVNGNSYNCSPVPSADTKDWQVYNGAVNNYFTGSTYSFSGFLPDNIVYWTRGDNRNAQIKMYLVDIVLFHLHSRINPQNIPILRASRYDGNNSFQSGGAIGWLKKVANGDVTANLPPIIPIQGNSIRWGSFPKSNNFY